MVDPISLTMASIQNDMQRMTAVANNAANALTPGFRRELAAVTGQSVVDGGSSGVGASVATLPIQSFVTDRKPGTPRKTGNPLDVALLGDGYFEVRRDGGAAYTRRGTFHVDDRGRLVTDGGETVSGVAGDIALTTPTPTIERDGKVYEKGVLVGQLKIVGFDQPEKLLSAGGGLWVAAEGQAPREESRTGVSQGYLESSNVDSAREMVTLVETMRHFEAGNRVLQAYDDMRDKTFRNLGQF